MLGKEKADSFLKPELKLNPGMMEGVAGDGAVVFASSGT